jgi:hypothetical protein
MRYVLRLRSDSYDNGLELKVGDKVRTFRGEIVEIIDMVPPHKTTSSGHVMIGGKTSGARYCYPSVINAVFCYQS